MRLPNLHGGFRKTGTRLVNYPFLLRCWTRTSVRRREKGSILVPVSLVLKQVRACTMRLEPRYDVTADSTLQPIADFNILDTQIHVSRSVSAIYTTKLHFNRD